MNKIDADIVPTMKVKRITQGCCDYVQNEIYEAAWEYTGEYVFVKGPSGWGSGHRFPGLWEIVEVYK